MAKKPILYWDSCMFFEHLGGESSTPTKVAAVNEILAANEKQDNLIVTSVVTHIEVLPTKLDDKGAADDQDYLALFDGVRFEEVEVSTNVILLAREIRDFYYVAADADGKGHKMMDLGDSIHLATAVIHKVDEFHTRDKDKKGSKVPLLGLCDRTDGKLCGKYPLIIRSPESAQGELLDVPKNGANDSASKARDGR